MGYQKTCMTCCITAGKETRAYPIICNLLTTLTGDYLRQNVMKMAMYHAFKVINFKFEITSKMILKI